MTRERGAISSAAFCPDGSLVAAGTSDAALLLVDAASGNLVREIQAGSAMVASLAFSPDGSRLAAGSPAGSRSAIRIRETSSWEGMASLTAWVTRCEAVAFTPDGSTLLVAGDGERMLTRFETGPPACGFEARARAQRARRLVNALFSRYSLSGEVAERIRSDPSLSEADRTAALALTRARGDQINYMNSAALGILLDPQRTEEEYRRALDKAQLVCQKRPDVYSFLNTLALAQFRVGEHEGALRTLKRCDELHRRLRGDSNPFDVAVAALCHARLDRPADALREIERLRALLREPAYAGDPEIRGIAAEAEASVGPR